MLDIRWKKETLLDLIKLSCAALLLASPWVLEFPPAAVWNLWVCGYAMLTVTAAALTAEADWEPHSNFCLGIWVAMAPWTLGFSQDAPAVFVPVLGGSVISLLSAVKVWTAERNPPWHFSPAAALRARLASSAMMAAEMPQPLRELAAARERPSHRRRRSAAMGRTLRRQPSHGRAKRQPIFLAIALVVTGPINGTRDANDGHPKEHGAKFTHETIEFAFL
jgi:hypothetical protein